MFLNDTIAAVSTPAGEGGIGIIRISGDKAVDTAEKIFISKKQKKIKDMKSYTMLYGNVIDPKNDERIDEVIVSFMKAPNTYTREDIIEINCHGGVMAVNKILSVILENGARLAEPGEFTKRAFLNGRIDLSQAEAVMDIIRSKTDESMKLALEQSEGKLSDEIKEIMNIMLKALAHIEASVDFPEDDIEDVVSNNVVEIGEEIYKKINKLIETADTGKILREGLNTIIIGKPNVGKSSLLNALIKESRAIVTEIPGTTRDIIEEYINIKGIPVKIVDTAGIREATDIVEKIGVEKSKEYIEKSDLIIMMLDADRHMEKEDEEIVKMIKGKKAIIAVNKTDLPVKLDMEKVKELFKEYPLIKTSINEGIGIEEIENEIVQMVYKGNVSAKNVYITNIRHKDILYKANESIKKALDTIKSGFPIDCASVEFRDAYLKLGEITGDTVADDIIDRIFNDFCIGK